MRVCMRGSNINSNSNNSRRGREVDSATVSIDSSD